MKYSRKGLQTMDQDAEFAKKLAIAEDIVSEELDADVILYDGGISRTCALRLNSQITIRRGRSRVALFLTTAGGDPDAAFRIARCLQNSYKHFMLFVGAYCKSAGTLISIGADQIILSDMAELGPLDIQIAKRDDFFARDSGLTPVQALATLKAETFKAFEEYFMGILTKSGGQITTLSAAKFATRLTTECFSRIYQQIDPMKLGEFERATNITFQYGVRLDRGNLIDVDALAKLITDYPLHGFVIDRKEAETLFKEVRAPNGIEQTLMDLVLELGSALQAKMGGTAIEFLSRRPMIPMKVPSKRGKSSGRKKAGFNEEVGITGGKPTPKSDRKDTAGQSGQELPTQQPKTRRLRKPRSSSAQKVDRNGKPV